MNNYILTSIIGSYCLLIIAFIYSITCKQIRSNTLFKWYIIYLSFILTIELLNFFFIEIIESKTTQFLFPFYVAGEFLILLNLFLKELKTSNNGHILKWVMTSYIFIETTFLWFFNDDATTGYGKIISHLTIIFLLAILLVKNLKELEKKNPISIIYVALFLYYGVSLFLFLIMNQLTEMNISIWIINNILSSILYGSSVYSFYKIKK
ncbi:MULTISPECIES: hypothetical protein [unclassified Olleya]|uniref:hypothetical protein n=1 Tax=unclassified Olleya TaxID=2615019 RepID=UPI000C303E6F|nr:MULTISPECIES: hypothetical protein [unclassified Olleya]AUC76399.1 hypothetical protein CW732_12275 [Olleya sp. Bg11-27]QXP58668.1 hypothetical protein H0I26_12170 [Olleya sp. HaHaR_3_96]